MMNQESAEEFSQEIPAICHENGVDFVALDGFTVLKLPQVQSAAASIAEPAIKPLEKCASCGSAKKRSPPRSHSSFHEPSAKRAAISTNPSSPDPSPPSSAERKRNTLRRSHSDFPRSPAGAYGDFPNSATLNSLNPSSPSPMPGNSKNPLAMLEFQDSFPMVPQPLHRSLSYPLSSSDYDQAVKTTPPRPPAVLRPQISPNSKKLREAKEKVEELMQWMGQAGCDQQEDEDAHPNDVNKEKAENRTQESVWVKQTEGGLILHFNCPCGEGYEVFLHGEKCYYRLT